MESRRDRLPISTITPQLHTIRRLYIPTFAGINIQHHQSSWRRLWQMAQLGHGPYANLGVPHLHGRLKRHRANQMRHIARSNNPVRSSNWRLSRSIKGLAYAIVDLGQALRRGLYCGLCASSPSCSCRPILSIWMD